MQLEIAYLFHDLENSERINNLDNIVPKIY